MDERDYMKTLEQQTKLAALIVFGIGIAFILAASLTGCGNRSTFK
jgi:hypothetical protein